MYDLAFVGGGPSSVFAILTLLSSGYEGKIALIEKGKLVENRDKKDVINGFGGAGTFSDGKLTSAVSVGGIIPGLTQEKLDEFNEYILHVLNTFKEDIFKPNNYLSWNETTNFDTLDSGLYWDVHKTCHMGTEVTREIFQNMEHYIISHSNVDVITNTEVIDVDYIKHDSYFRLHVVGDYHKKNNEAHIKTKNVILATGQKNNLPGRLISKFELTNTPRAFQLGVRVDDVVNSQYEEIIRANYDFKFVKNYVFDNGVKIRIRTFCCNSGNAHVCAEQASEGFICFNGHAFKKADPLNHSVNYGIMCEVEGLEDYKDKTQQIDLMRKVNNLPTWAKDNYKDGEINSENLSSSRKLLDGFPQLKGVYPDCVIEALEDFISRLNKLVPLDKAYYYYPEVKLSGSMPNLNFETFETEMPGLFMIGDAAITRGIVKSAYTGVKMARSFLERNK